MAVRRKTTKRGRAAAGGRARPKKGARKAASKKAPRKAAKRKKATRKKATARKPAPPKPNKGHRLARDVRPTDVDVSVEVDPTVGPAVSGEVAHTLVLDKRRKRIELHADDLRVSAPRLEQDGRTLRGRIEPRPERETIEVVFDEPIPAGEATLRLRFRGKLRKDLRGLYAASSGERQYAFTQLEAADARRFFPCFDEPSFKARFRLSVTTGNGNTVISNNPVEKVEPIGGGQKTVHFERTPLLSTYLLALGVGELQASEPTHCGDTEIRIWHVPGKEGLADFGLETARETLSRLEAYFDLPYPYEKLDLVAVPDFEAGAMENAGAVFFRETLLLVDPKTATLQEKKRVAEVVCHELAHMWYGDLVTMAWWDDLWLNEAFATWMAFHVVDRWKPEWRMWNDFQHYRSAALGMDALQQTHPIYMKVGSPEEATENFDLITYEKGASVVRMVERFLGEDVFRAGVRRYVREHAESNTVASDLWNALAEASGQDVEPVVRAWIEQPGFPVLRLARGVRKGQPVLNYRQERFSADPKASARRKQAAQWPIPWVGRTGSARRPGSVRALLTAQRGTIPLEGSPAFVYGNADEGGFFRPHHAAEELEAIAAGREQLAAVERMGLVGHQWALVRAGHAAVDAFLDLAMAFGAEPDPDVLLTLAGPLESCARSAGRSLGDAAESSLRGRVAETFAPGLAAAGWDPVKGEPDERRLVRSALLQLAGSVGGDPAILAEAGRRADAYVRDRHSLEPNLADGVVGLGARCGEAERFDRFEAAASDSATPQEQRRFLFALGSFASPALVGRALALLLGDSVGTQDVAILLTRLLQNPAAGPQAWEFTKRRWPALRRRMPPMLVTRPIDALPSLGTKAARRDVASFFRDNPVPTGARAVKQALEQFDLTLAFDDRAAPRLRRWLG